MTVTNVQRLRSAARPLPLRASLAGLLVGLCAALGSTAWAAPAAAGSPAASAPLGTAAATTLRTPPAKVASRMADKVCMDNRGPGGRGGRDGQGL